MNTSKKYIIVSGLLGTVLAGWMLIRPVSLKENVQTRKPYTRLLTEKDKDAQKTVSRHINSAPAESNRDAVNSPPSLNAKENSEFAQTISELAEFKKAHEKPFKSPAEENLIRFTLKNYSKLKAAAEFLSNTQFVNDENTLSRNAAVDLLIEALKNGDQKVATELILAVVQDSQIENTKLDIKTRETMAETKAELLFHATQIPSRTIQNSISGPVTQKIWDRVQALQTENAAESEAERQMQMAQASKRK